jgi:hypothetical protein
MSPNFKEEGEVIHLEKPYASAYAMGGGVWQEKDIPMLLNVFEFIVRNTLLQWWKTLGTPG